ncbi:MAG: TraR/DksA C4-type zinc finger protein [Campylobacterales bacterium]|nr:TraR/DksA C4-type zinc finger protein [Campylobacterales bacterium]
MTPEERALLRRTLEDARAKTAGEIALLEPQLEPIAPARLALVPEATLCVACAKEKGE